MKLPDAPEPLHIKSGAAKQRQENPNKSWDSLYLWIEENVASYLWTENGWKAVLESRGVYWNDFQKIVRLMRLKWWARGELDWNQITNSDEIDKLAQVVRRNCKLL
jgi:hypothetical protein